MSIYRRNKIWWIKYRLNKRIIRYSLETTDKQVAKYKEGKILSEIAEGKLPPGFRKVKANVALDEYLQAAELAKGPRTIKTDRPRLKSFLAWSRVAELKQIDRKLIEDYLGHRLREEKVKPLTANHTLSIIKAWLNWCINRSYLVHNPAQGIKKYKTEKNPPRFLSVDETHRLLEAAKDNHLYPMISTAVYTGMRLGELLRLDWKDIDFNRSQIMVANKAGNPTKSKKFRIIPLSPVLKKILEPYKKKEGICFRDIRGKSHHFPKPFYNILERANLKDVGWHTLRHTFASHLVMQGVDLVTIKDLLGHASIQTTMIYSHLTSEHTKQAIQKLPY